MTRRCTVLTGLASLIFSLIFGCSSQRVEPPPPTQKVEGVVLRKDGKPAGPGAIEFRHAKNPEFVSLGDVGADGKFVLRTIGGRQDAAGAQEGEHTVTYTPSSEKQEQMIPMELSKKYVIKAGDNNLTVTLEK